MSRSRKKHPHHGIAKCESEKRDKQLASRAYRRAIRLALIRDPFADTFPTMWEVCTNWTFGKDGKTHFDPDAMPELMRK